MRALTIGSSQMKAYLRTLGRAILVCATGSGDLDGCKTLRANLGFGRGCKSEGVGESESEAKRG